MRLRPLVINEQVLRDVARVVQFAEEHRYNLHDLFDMVRGRLRPPGDNAGHICVLPLGYRVVFSIDQQPEPMGWARHLSVSVIGPGECPNPAAVVEISRLFGMRPWNAKDTSVVMEDIHEGYGAGSGKKAVNVVQGLTSVLEPT